MSAVEELWAAIPGYPRYEASTLGRVRSWCRGEPRLLRTRVNCKNGRVQVDLCVGNARKTMYTYQLVLLAFRGPPPPGMVARHVQTNDLSNNGLANLEYGTRLENAADMLRHGTRRSGEKHQCAKYSDAFMARIAADPRKQVVIAAEYGLPRKLVSYFKRGWRSDPRQAERKHARRAARALARCAPEIGTAVPA